MGSVRIAGVSPSHTNLPHINCFSCDSIHMVQCYNILHQVSSTHPDVQIPEELLLQVISALRIEINGGLAVLRDIASGKDLKKFLGVIAGLWIMSLLGGCCNFLTLFYIAFVLLQTVPVIYKNYEDQVDSFAEKAMHEIKKQYAVFDAKVLSKIPRVPLKNKKVAS